MDSKSLAKSKRAHSLHHSKKHHHPNQKSKGATTATTSAGGALAPTNKAPATAKQKPLPPSQTHLPSNWDRYQEEEEEDQSSQPGGVVVPQSKGADYAYLLSEAKSQNSSKISSGFFPSLDDFVSDFGQGKDSFFAVRGESLLSSIQNDTFFVEDKTSANYESSFLSLSLHDLSEQLAKIDLPSRLFMEEELFPLELLSERSEEQQNSSQSVDITHKVTSPTTTKSNRLVIQDDIDSTNLRPMVQPNESQSKLKAETAETELDMLLDSFADASLKENALASTSTSTSKGKTVDFDIDGTLDDLLKETSTPSLIDQNSASPTHEVKSNPLGSKSELLDDFDSWLDTI
uniref:uncharacterized protein LOC122589140 n=1 Tax=Erigeron canadensis TaxID=72917 RepID=UPI001CB94F6C|nr:uncharacterized protein LOC122589140 [Erigeron canadensis]